MRHTRAVLMPLILLYYYEVLDKKMRQASHDALGSLLRIIKVLAKSCGGDVPPLKLQLLLLQW
jgi:hypothetical protein